jgi:hypothetical protein
VKIPLSLVACESKRVNTRAVLIIIAKLVKAGRSHLKLCTKLLGKLHSEISMQSALFAYYFNPRRNQEEVTGLYLEDPVFAPCSPIAGGNINWIGKSDEEIIDATMGELARLFPTEIALRVGLS